MGGRYVLLLSRRSRHLREHRFRPQPSEAGYNVIRQFASRQFLVFLLSGGFAAAVNFGSRIIYSQWLDFSTAIAIAYLTGMATAFILNRIFVFKNSGNSIHQSLLWFAVINIIAIFQTWLISITLAYYLLPWLGVHQFTPEIAHLIGVVIPVFTSYIGHKHWTFR
ncbi:GtrA family protein [uncultured Thiothrix sp.]|uniref:GtrA family protein n=1 Tax=uncultured Thiothrix sp. TaxID=223185 RepID=UPI00260B18EA|nr:GtrA family protein [uncultured Thiothrix sp.]